MATMMQNQPLPPTGSRGDDGMDAPVVLSNAQVVTPEAAFAGSVVIRDGLVEEVRPDTIDVADAVDCAGDLVMPGMVDLHTDNLESQARPRPGVYWDAVSAAVAHDGLIASVGITTVFDSLVVGLRDEDQARHDLLDGLVAALRAGAQDDLFRAEHCLHLRCELTDPNLFDRVIPFLNEPTLRLISLMEHTAGQRQFANEAKYRELLVKRYGKREEEVDRLMADDREASRTFAPEYRARMAAMAQEHGLPVASHDDETVEHIREASALGVAIAEFPTTLAAARSARAAGQVIVAGAPNMVRGSSQAGNVSVADLAAERLIDVIASDYVPVALLRAALMLCDGDSPYTLPEAVATVTRNPARAVGLDDRGEIRSGARADLIRVRRHGRQPLVRAVWRAGRRVA